MITFALSYHICLTGMYVATAFLVAGAISEALSK